MSKNICPALRIEDLVCCAWHKPGKAIVELKTGAIVPREVLDRIPDSPQKEHMMFSGGMCDPCMNFVISSSRFARMQPKEEGILKAAPSPDAVAGKPVTSAAQE
ncbi:MAG: hypothetical protein AB1324_03415 [Candidatus Micrarchaeota archaeon]